MTELALMLGLKHSTTSPYNSKANGRVEVAHKSMQTMMRAYMEDHVEVGPVAPIDQVHIEYINQQRNWLYTIFSSFQVPPNIPHQSVQ